MKEYNDFILKLQNREHDKRSIPILNQSGTPETLGWLLSQANSVPDEVAIDWLVGAMVQIGTRLQRRDDWAFTKIEGMEDQIRIILRHLNSLTLREMAVSFPWPTREMAGAEVLPIRSMKPEEKQKWLQQLWGLINIERSKEKEAKLGPSTESNARFEAPRARSKSPNPLSRVTSQDRPASPPSVPGGAANSNKLLEPSVGSLRRSNATNARLAPPSPGLPRARRHSGAATLGVPGVPYFEDNNSRVDAGVDQNYANFAANTGVSINYGNYSSDYNTYSDASSVTYAVSTFSNDSGYYADDRQPRSQTPASGGGRGGEVNLTRLLSVKKPSGSVLSDAMALALFRVDED